MSTDPGGDSEPALSNRTVGYWFKRYSDRARKAMAIANRDAKQAGQESITPANVLFGLLAQPQSVACHVLVACGVEPQTVLADIGRTQDIPDEHDSRRLPADEATHRLVDDSIRLCIANRYNGVGTEHLLVSLSQCDLPEIEAIFSKYHLDHKQLNTKAIQLLAGGRDQRDTIWIRVVTALFFAILSGLVFSTLGVLLAYALAYRGIESWQPTLGELMPKIAVVWSVASLLAFSMAVVFRDKRSQFGACALISLLVSALAGIWFFILVIVGFGAV